jgi:hypothetical protein
MKIITDALSSDDNWNGECDYAFLEITPDKAKKYLSYMETVAAMKKENINIYCLQFFSYDVSFFSAHDALHKVKDVEGNLMTESNSGNLVAVVPDDYELPEEPEVKQRTEGELVVVTEDSIKWKAYIKHTGVQVRTESLSKELIQSILPKHTITPNHLFAK